MKNLKNFSRALERSIGSAEVSAACGDAPALLPLGPSRPRESEAAIDSTSRGALEIPTAALAFRRREAAELDPLGAVGPAEPAGVLDAVPVVHAADRPEVHEETGANAEGADEVEEFAANLEFGIQDLVQILNLVLIFHYL